MPEKKTILIIEPYSMLRDAYTEYFTTNGYSVIEYATGEGLETFCRENSFDLVMVNIEYAGLPGFDLIKEIKILVPHVKTIGIAFNYFKPHADTLKEIGADGYLLNTISPKILLQVVGEVAAGKQYYIER